MRRGKAVLSVAVMLALMLTAASPAALPCDADLDDDGQVGVTDFLSLLSAWGTDPGGPPDFDGAGVGVTDMLALLAAWGPIGIEFPALPDAEAEQIALEMLGTGGPLLVPPEIYDRVAFDLTAIRAAVPELADQAHTPAWLPNELIVNLDPGASQDEYECLNERHQLIAIDNIFDDWWVLTFAGNLNVPALVQLYAATPAVLFAEPNGIIGGQNFWSPQDLGNGTWRWTIDDGFCDCFDGCDCHVVYVIETSAGGAVHVGSVQESGQPWCDFKSGGC